MERYSSKSLEVDNFPLIDDVYVECAFELAHVILSRARADAGGNAVAEGDKEAAEAALKIVVPYIDKASTKGVIHKSTASRKISRLDKLVNTLA